MQGIKSIRMNLYMHFHDDINTPRNTDLLYSGRSLKSCIP